MHIQRKRWDTNTHPVTQTVKTKRLNEFNDFFPCRNRILTIVYAVRTTDNSNESKKKAATDERKARDQPKQRIKNEWGKCVIAKVF